MIVALCRWFQLTVDGPRLERGGPNRAARVGPVGQRRLRVYLGRFISPAAQWPSQALPEFPLEKEPDHDFPRQLSLWHSRFRGGGRDPGSHRLNHLGEKIFETDLPSAVSGSWNGALAAPTLGNIDADANLEVAVNTSGSGVVAYDLPGTAKPRILWGTGRGSNTRNAAK
jgi:hypothetical protein